MEMTFTLDARFICGVVCAVLSIPFLIKNLGEIKSFVQFLGYTAVTQYHILFLNIAVPCLFYALAGSDIFTKQFWENPNILNVCILIFGLFGLLILNVHAFCDASYKHLVEED